MAPEQARSERQEPGLVERAKQAIEADRQKLGGMTFGASMRLGLAELREAASLGGNVVQPTPYGMFGTVTPGEVAAARQDDPQVQQMEQEPVRLASPSQSAEDGQVATVHGDPRVAAKPSPSPGDIADDPSLADPQQQERGTVHGRHTGTVHGRDAGPSRGNDESLPSPSQIAEEPIQPKQEAQQQSHDQERHMERKR